MADERALNIERTALYMRVREACREALARGVTVDELRSALSAADEEVEDARATLGI